MFNIRILSKDDIAKVSDMRRVIEGVESVYRAKSNGEAEAWPTVFYEFEPGKADLDIKSGYLKSLGLFGHKTVSFFGDNAAKGLPTLNGIIVVYDASTGAPLCVTDGAYITGMRTGAAGAIGAKYLADPDAQDLFILGAGNQAAFQIAAMLTLFPGIRRVRVCDAIDPENAERFVGGICARLDNEFGVAHDGVEFTAVRDIASAVSESLIIVTVTPSRSPVIKKEWVRPGTHFSCIGSDMEGKEEIDPEIMRGALIFTDDKEHCMQVGEIEIPLKTGVIGESDIAGEIGDLITGRAAGRRTKDDITIFDATGMALLDILTAKTMLDLANEKGLGSEADI